MGGWDCEGPRGHMVLLTQRFCVSWIMTKTRNATSQRLVAFKKKSRELRVHTGTDPGQDAQGLALLLNPYPALSTPDSQQQLVKAHLTIKKAERQRIDGFKLWCWRRLERPLDSKEIKPVHPKRNQP